MGGIFDGGKNRLNDEEYAELQNLRTEFYKIKLENETLKPELGMIQTCYCYSSEADYKSHLYELIEEQKQIRKQIILEQNLSESQVNEIINKIPKNKFWVCDTKRYVMTEKDYSGIKEVIHATKEKLLELKEKYKNQNYLNK